MRMRALSWSELGTYSSVSAGDLVAVFYQPRSLAMVVGYDDTDTGVIKLLWLDDGRRGRKLKSELVLVSRNPDPSKDKALKMFGDRRVPGTNKDEGLKPHPH